MFVNAIVYAFCEATNWTIKDYDVESAATVVIVDDAIQGRPENVSHYQIIKKIQLNRIKICQ